MFYEIAVTGRLQNFLKLQITSFKKMASGLSTYF